MLWEHEPQASVCTAFSNQREESNSQGDKRDTNMFTSEDALNARSKTR